MTKGLYRKISARRHGLTQFQPKVEISFHMGHYWVKTATSKAEVLSSLQLRHEVFVEEMAGRKHPSGIDIDRYDSFFDHLVIIDTRTNNVIATYRLHQGDQSADFYSRSEFDLSGLAQMKGPFLELGRACVHRDHRRGVVMTLLWRGIAEYMNASQSRVLLGCGSIKTEDAREAAILMHSFERGAYTRPDPLCTPLESYAMPKFHEELAKVRAREWTDEDEKLSETLVTSLFKSYLKAGAIVGGFPAWDPAFHCIDFIVCLEIEKLSGLYGRKYKVEV